MTTRQRAYHLPGKVCPNCESTGPFLLDPSDKFTIAADGHLEFPPDEWGLDIACDCPTCGFAARLEDFCVWVEATGEEREAAIRGLLESYNSAHLLTADDERHRWWGGSFDGTTMMDRRNQLPVREVAQSVYESLFLDLWPSPAGINDFGLESSEHYGALQYAVKHDGVTVEDLDDALGWGPALTKLISETNPYRGVTFRTVWDTIMIPIKDWAAVANELYPLGRLFATPEVMKLATRAEIFDALRRHAKGDFGEGDAAKNHAEMGDGNEVLSCYRIADGSPFFVRTWLKPPMTLVLLESQLEL